jgi:protein-disulfide isomerase
MDDRLLMIGAALVMAALIGAVILVQGPQSPLGPSKDTLEQAHPPPQPSGPSPAAPPPVAPVVDMKGLASSGLTEGSLSAPVVMVEFSDYQCPFCRKFWLEDYPSLKTQYIDTGKVELVYKDFPLDFHPQAEMSAEAVACAEEQGQGWALHDKIFEEQAAVGTGTVQYSKGDLERWAAALGLDNSTFDACLDSGRYAAAVNQTYSQGTALGIDGTPSFIIGKRDGSNVVPINGALPYGTFSATIDQLLK